MFRPKPSPDLNLVELKNGTEVPAYTMIRTMESLKCIQDNVIALYELLEKCKNFCHEMFGDTEELAEENGLMSNGMIHPDTRNVILSAVESDGPYA